MTHALHTAVVYSLLSKLEQTRILSTAITQRFENNSKLDQAEAWALEQLTNLGLIAMPHQLNEEIKSFLVLQEESNQAQQKLKALAIRMKTLEMQVRNIQEEISKIGFFGAKNKQELEQKEKQFITDLNQIHLSSSDLQRKLELPDEQLKKIAEILNMIQSEEDIKCIDGKAVLLKREAELLLGELRQMNMALLGNQPLGQVLKYGFLWTMEQQNLKN
jgi:hypothetical protein